MHVLLLTTDPPSPVTEWMIARLNERPGIDVSISTDDSMPDATIDIAILRMYARGGGADGAQADLRANRPHPSLELAMRLQQDGVRVINDAREGLPAEIRLRRNQYEYYRDRLLSFEGLQDRNDK